MLRTLFSQFFSALMIGVRWVFATKDKCKLIHVAKDDDGLDYLVSVLPPSYTSRFGEIVWAAGGTGFGW